MESIAVDALAKYAYVLEGSSRYVSAVQLSRLCESCDQLARTVDTKGVQTITQDLRRRWHLTAHALQDLQQYSMQTLNIEWGFAHVLAKVL